MTTVKLLLTDDEMYWMPTILVNARTLLQTKLTTVFRDDPGMQATVQHIIMLTAIIEKKVRERKGGEDA